MSDSLPFDELRKILERQAQTSANAADVGDRLNIEGYPFIQPVDKLWVHFTYSLGQAFAAEAGQAVKDRRLHRSVGLIEITLLYPENSGNGEAVRVADRLRKQWTLQKKTVADVGHYTIGAMGQQPIPLAPKGWKRILCSATLDFFYRD